MAALSAVPSASQGDPFSAAVQHALEFARAQLDAASRSISSTSYPSSTGSSGSWSTTGPGSWTSGFFPGCLWLLFDWSGEARWRTAAEVWQVALEGEKNDTSTHDVGFKIFSSFGNGFRLTGDEAQRQVTLTGAASLSTRYSPIVGAIRSWNGPTSSDFRVIIDNMLNLELLFWGSKHGGDLAWYDMAVSHALKTRENHLRSDGSTYQVVNFDPSTGAVKEKGTHQGHDDESTWSRGQAWALHGFTMSFRETGDARFLDAARRTADYFVTHLPPDSVPFWDLELPSTVGEPRDSSAGAIAAAGLLELARLEPDAVRSLGYLDAARDILAALASPVYLAEGTGDASVLLHGTQNRPDGRFDTGLIYGDYYFVQALLRYQRWFGLAPAASDGLAETAAGQPVDVVMSASDGQECELLFSIVDPPAHGSLGALGQEACHPGTPNVDTSRVMYLPVAGFTGMDSFSYRVSDGTNDSNLAIVSLTVHPAGGSVATFPALADAKVNSASPTKNYGTETTLRVRGGSSEWRTYARFQVSGLGGPVSAARLRLYVTDGSNDGGRVFPVASTWTETGLTWNNAPATTGTPLATGGAVASGSWVEYDVTAQVTGNGAFSFALSSLSTDSAYFSSREGAHAPELLVTSGSPLGDTTPPVLLARTPPAGAVSVPVDTNVTASLDEPVAGVSNTTFLLWQGATPVAALTSYDPATRTALLDPVADLSASTTYTATLTSGITDLATPPNALVPVSWSFTTASAPPPVTTFPALADAKVNSASPTKNYGTETTLRVRGGSSEWRTYVKFQVSGLLGAVSTARLRLYVTDSSNDGGRVFPVASTWTETGLTWNNAPATTGSPLATGGAVASGSWVEYDVSAQVTGNGIFSFALSSLSTNSAYFSSRDGAHAPELVVSAQP